MRRTNFPSSWFYILLYYYSAFCPFIDFRKMKVDRKEEKLLNNRRNYERRKAFE